MEFEGRKKIDTNLNIAPLIDVVFQLLIFFMLSASFIAQPGIKLSLPSSSESKPRPDEAVTVFITENNDLYLNEERVTLGGLLEKLRPKILKAENKTVIIKADEKIDLGLAVKVMDIAKQAEAGGVVISTRAGENAEQ